MEKHTALMSKPRQRLDLRDRVQQTGADLSNSVRGQLQCLHHRGLGHVDLGANRVGLFIGTSTSGILQTELAYRQRDPGSGALPADFHYAGTHNTFSAAAFVRQLLGIQGPAAVVSTACSSSAKAFGAAQRMIELGIIDAAVVGGVVGGAAEDLANESGDMLEVLGRHQRRPVPQDRGRRGNRRECGWLDLCARRRGA